MPSSATVLHGEAAYSHLLEVICGLDSPMVGETEVLHQFKVFAADLPGDHNGLREIGNHLLADARAIRARHLIGLGSRSYGSAVRRYVADASCVAVGGHRNARQRDSSVPRPPASAGRSVGRRLECHGFDAGITYRRLDVATPVIDAADRS
jgi:hypothetical protein